MFKKENPDSGIMIKCHRYSALKRVDRPYGHVHWVPAEDEGFKDLSLHVFIMKPGGKTSKHHHPSEEIFFILQGTGMMEGKEQRFRVSKDDVILIPPGDVHSLDNLGEDDLIFIAAMSPPRDRGKTRFL